MATLPSHYLYEVSAALTEALRDANLQMPIALEEWCDESPILRGGAVIWLRAANNSNLRRALIEVAGNPGASANRVRITIAQEGRNRIALDFQDLGHPPSRHRIKNAMLQAACDALRLRLGVTCHTVYQHEISPL